MEMGKIETENINSIAARELNVDHLHINMTHKS